MRKNEVSFLAATKIDIKEEIRVMIFTKSICIFYSNYKIGRVTPNL
jgi:hypothetical protein